MRDIAKISFLKKSSGPLSLKNMCLKFLEITIQGGQHSSVEDARAAMAVYKKFRKQVEVEMKNKNYVRIQQRLLADIKALSSLSEGKEK